LSAALILGRCRRSVLICDTGRPRNARAAAIHGFLTRDGLPPAQFLEIARSQLASYPSVDFRHTQVVAADCQAGGTFLVTLASGEEQQSRSLVLATGVIDELPPIPGLEPLYGRSVFHCPYCDGWEWRDRRLAVYGRGAGGMGLAAKLSLWSRDLVVCTDGPHEMLNDQVAALRKTGATIVTEPIATLEAADGDAGQLRAIHFTNGSSLERDAMFVTTHQVQASTLPAGLGCEDRERRSVPTDEHQKTQIKGLYVIGDASRDVQMVIIAAAEGADAAFSINKYLMSQELPNELID
jgi:thioredoxin reductase